MVKTKKVHGPSNHEHKNENESLVSKEYKLEKSILPAVAAEEDDEDDVAAEPLHKIDLTCDTVSPPPLPPPSPTVSPINKTKCRHQLCKLLDLNMSLCILVLDIPAWLLLHSNDNPTSADGNDVYFSSAWEAVAAAENMTLIQHVSLLAMRLLDLLLARPGAAARLEGWRMSSLLFAQHIHKQQLRVLFCVCMTRSIVRILMRCTIRIPCDDLK